MNRRRPKCTVGDALPITIDELVAREVEVPIAVVIIPC